MSTLSTIGLSLYVLATLAGLTLLAYDEWRWKTGRETITTWAKSRRRRVWVVFLLALVGPIGLLLHLLT